jgi:hypothetical protein
MDEETLIELISRIRRRRQEWKTVDAKRELVLQEVGDKAEFVKDVIAMANNAERSYLLIGLEDGTFSDVGLLAHHYEKNDLNQLLIDKIDPPVIVDYQEFTINEIEYGIVEIFGNNPPYIVARDVFHNRTDRKQTRIYKGTIYVRHEDRTEGISRSELEELLNRKGLKKEFENETERALQIALERPQFWEYLLTAELLSSKLILVRRRFSELRRGLIYKKSIRLGETDFINWTQTKAHDLCSLASMFGEIVNKEIPLSWGPTGQPGDPSEIKDAIDKAIAGCDELLDWECDLRSVIPPDSIERLKKIMEGWTSPILDAIETLPQQLLQIVEQPNPSGKYHIEIIFKSPPNINEFTTEIERLDKLRKGRN